MRRLLTRASQFIVVGVIMLSGLFIGALLPSQPVAAKCSTEFLGFPTWYDGLVNSDCEIRAPQNDKGGAQISRFVWRIVLNVLEIVLRVIGFISVGYIIYGGYRYLVSSGLPDKTVAARKTIQNAVIGLVISFFSVVVVTLIANNIG